MEGVLDLFLRQIRTRVGDSILMSLVWHVSDGGGEEERAIERGVLTSPAVERRYT